MNDSNNTDSDLQQQLEARLSDMEIKLAFQDDLLSTLNDVMAKQDREIQDLWRANKLLKQGLTDLKSDTGQIDQEAPPPHY